MREILFRGKRADNGEWVEGFYVKYGPAGNEKDCIIPEYASALYAFEIIPETVGQYTGRIGEDEKKIFEGDMCILTTFDHNGYDTQHDVVVEYLGGSFFFVDKNKEHYFLVSDIEDTESDVVICGSIHDNPELLEGAAE